jgi:hypothetical protein
MPLKSRLTLTLRTGLIAAFGLWLAAPAWSETFFFTTGNTDGKMAALTRPAASGKLETETADDFALEQTTVISGAVITGLLVPAGTPLAGISQVEVEIYHIFPQDSDMVRAINVPTRQNSPADVEIDSATRDSLAGTLGFSSALLTGNFTAAASVVDGIKKKPDQRTQGDGPKTGDEITITINFATPIILPAGHYFLRPEVRLTTGDFLWLSAARPILPPGTPFPADFLDLQAWIRNTDLKPDWLRIGGDIIGGTTPPTFNMTFSLIGNTISEAGTPGQPNCPGKTVSAFAHQFKGMADAATALGASSVGSLHDAIHLFCGR